MTKTNFSIFLAALFLFAISCSSSKPSASNKIHIPQINVDTLTVYNPNEIDQEPKLRRGIRSLQLNIGYPEAARKDGAEGTIRLEFIVLKTGEVVNGEVIQSVHPALDKASLNALAQATFKPAVKDGEAVNVQHTLPIGFGLNKKN